MSTEQLIEALKRVLKSRHITYAVLARQIGMSEASVKRLFSQRTFTLNRLEQVLAALELDFFELAKLARGAGDAPQEMTEPAGARAGVRAAPDGRVLPVVQRLDAGANPDALRID